MAKFVFAWPRPNGDLPTVCVREGADVAEAIRTAFVERDSSDQLDGCTVHDADHRPIGLLRLSWPGPVVTLGGEEVWRVGLMPGRKGAWSHARWGRVEAAPSAEDAGPSAPPAFS